MLLRVPVLRSVVAIRGFDTDEPLSVLEARQRAAHRRMKPGRVRLIHGEVHTRGLGGELLYAAPDGIAYVSLVIKLNTVDTDPVFLIDYNKFTDVPDDEHWILELTLSGSPPASPISLKIRGRLGPSIQTIFASGPMSAHNQVIRQVLDVGVEIEKAARYVALEVEITEEAGLAAVAWADVTAGAMVEVGLEEVGLVGEALAAATAAATGVAVWGVAEVAVAMAEAKAGGDLEEVRKAVVTACLPPMQ